MPFSIMTPLSVVRMRSPSRCRRPRATTSSRRSRGKRLPGKRGEALKRGAFLQAQGEHQVFAGAVLGGEALGALGAAGAGKRAVQPGGRA